MERMVNLEERKKTLIFSARSDTGPSKAKLLAKRIQRALKYRTLVARSDGLAPKLKL